jgi:hypothetical protein
MTGDRTPGGSPSSARRIVSAFGSACASSDGPSTAVKCPSRPSASSSGSVSASGLDVATASGMRRARAPIASAMPSGTVVSRAECVR